MKPNRLKLHVAAAVLAAAALPASAQTCPCSTGDRITGAALVNLLAGRTVCGKLGADNWQEFHSGATAAGGPLIDWKLGPGHPVDPSKQVGTWSVADASGTNTVVLYTYDGITYSYAVCQAGTQFNFCAAANPTNRRSDPRVGNNVLGVTLLNGQVACAATRSSINKR